MAFYPSNICPASKNFPWNILGSNQSQVTRVRLNRSVKMTFSGTGRTLRFSGSQYEKDTEGAEISRVFTSWQDWHVFEWFSDPLWRHFSWWNYVGELKFFSCKNLVFSKPISLLKCKDRKFSSQNTFRSRLSLNQVKDCRNACFSSLYTLSHSHNFPFLRLSSEASSFLEILARIIPQSTVNLEGKWYL